MLRIGLPKGSLEEKTGELLQRAGFFLSPNGKRCFLFKLESNQIIKEALFLRPQMIPEAVAEAVVDCGICGLDCLLESGLDQQLEQISKLNYGKAGDQPVKVVAFARESDLNEGRISLSKAGELISKKPLNIISEYPNLAQSNFPGASIAFSYGGTEQMVAYGKYDIGIGVTETGSSLKANGLKVLKVICSSPVVLVASKTSLNNDSQKKKEKIDLLGRLFSSVFTYRQYRLVKFNLLDQDRLAKIRQRRFYSEELTISELSEGGKACEALVRKADVPGVIDFLSANGASKVIVQEIQAIL